MIINLILTKEEGISNNLKLPVMKKLLFLMMIGFFSTCLYAQKELEETKVEPPHFRGVIIEKETPVIEKSPICRYIEKELVYPEEAKDFFHEGVVVVQFTVKADASVSDFIVENSVSYELDRSVIDCLKSTDGMWIPGKVNGINSPMEKKVYVKFDVLDTPSLNELALSSYNTAIKRYQKAVAYKDNPVMAENKKNKKSERRFNWSLNHLEKATTYKPNDPSILFWQARNYSQLGDFAKMNEKLEKYLEIINAQMAMEEFEDGYDLAVIVH